MSDWGKFLRWAIVLVAMVVTGFYAPEIYAWIKTEAVWWGKWFREILK